MIILLSLLKLYNRLQESSAINQLADRVWQVINFWYLIMILLYSAVYCVYTMYTAAVVIGEWWSLVKVILVITNNNIPYNIV